MVEQLKNGDFCPGLAVFFAIKNERIKTYLHKHIFENAFFVRGSPLDDDEDDEDDDSNDEFIVIYLRKAKERDGQCDVIFVVVRGDEKFPIVIIL